MYFSTHAYTRERMHRIQIPVTGIGLVGLFVYPEVGVFRNLVIANSIAGLLYMHSEYEALHTRGSMILGVAFRAPNEKINTLYNISLHLLLPCILLLRRRTTRKRASVAHSIGLYVLGLILLDLDAIYPTRDNLTSYIQLHVAVFAMSHFLKTCEPCNHPRSKRIVIDGACACTYPSP